VGPPGKVKPRSLFYGESHALCCVDMNAQRASSIELVSGSYFVLHLFPAMETLHHAAEKETVVM